MKQRLKTYKLDYELDADKHHNKPLKEYIFKAKNEHHAQLIANEFCDQNWARIYFLCRIKKSPKVS